MRETRGKGRSAVILDRHPLWLSAMDELVSNVGVEVVGRAIDADEAVALVEELRPDVFVAGVDPAHTEQVDCVREARRVHPDVKTVVMADSADPNLIAAAFCAGASVYCVKTAEQDDLASAIRQAFERSIFIASLNAEYAGHEPVRQEPVEHALTRRELEILQLVAEGHSNSQLARMLWVTEQTVKFHLSNIYRKLNVANRTEASRWAQLHGLLSSGDELGEPVPAAA